jgi:hypothetical protein
MRMSFKLIEVSKETGVAAEFEAARKRTTLIPEQELMLAVLEDATTCYQKHLLAKSDGGKILFRDAEEWILNQRNDSVFSFESICEVLGLSPNYVRLGLLRIKERTLGSRPTAKIYSLTADKNVHNPATHVAEETCAECAAKKRRFA